MKPRDYCCCAIPLVNAGIYTVLVEQFTLGIVAGTLAVATPQIVGAATFSFAKWIFAIICYVGAAIQLFGFFGVLQERPIMYRRYTTLHLLIMVAGFSVAAVWIAISAARHKQAKSACQATFFAVSTTDLGDTLCNIFPWVDIGLMGGLWALLAAVQLYFYFVLSSYGTGQRLDHEKYDSMYDPTKPLTSDIPLNNRGWDAQPSNEVIGQAGYHSKQASFSSVYTDKQQQAQDFGGYGQAATYPPNFPNYAHTQDPGPTPFANEYYATEGGPEPVQPHPGTSLSIESSQHRS
ncbi:hypothetical protein EUX98_g6123 [Antrodiella citrinella]|uniref:Uncharacterized protein n=1 Tax=Antrodiella citrinella TaxID=2447956 RepID=A0A4S4MPY0_9APHY|nr:hypothetical protein EUX98_g6123 [Antrodiella citrinella]